MTDRAADAEFCRREREILDILYSSGKATASEVKDAMKTPPTYSRSSGNAPRAGGKGGKHENKGLKYVYMPVVNPEKVKRSAIKHLIDTFFLDSPEQVVAALLDVSSKRLTPKELDRMAEMIEEAKKKEGK